ncbi:phage tail spike protein [Faecalimonas umbilicata]|uniref:phage tail spike protein n=1 Tax=Faecalimonas umbilicata TaxID=1912855 RepID=UPI003992AB7A
MENIRIAVLSANDELHTFMDNEAPEALHYYEDELHEYLQGAANTFAFTAMAKHQDSIYLVEGNKLAFVCNGRDYYLNIMSVSRDEYEVEVEAFSTSFELLNESVGEYDPGKAVSFESYLNTFDPEHSLSLGINEVSGLNVWHKFTGQETILKRLYSVADMFLAELEFVPELNADHSLKRTVLNVYREHSDKNQGVGKDRTDIKLRYGVNVNGIRKTTDIAELATAIRPTGADGLNLLGFESTRKDEKGNIEFQTVKNSYDIWAVKARDRFPSNRVSYDRYIVQTKEYEEKDVNSLFLAALNDLKKMCVPKVTYEVDGYFDTGIGDTVMIEDDGYNPTLYLQARVSEQVRSFTEPSRNKTIFSNFKELQSQVDNSLLDKMNALIQENKTYNCMILSDNGIVFKNGEGTTTLAASVTAPGADLTDKFAIIWKKDGSEIARKKSIVVSAADIVGKAVYRFEAMEGEKLRGYYEVTVSNVDDGEPGSPGKSYYTWIKFADDGLGNGMSDYPDGKQYMGIAYNKETLEESNNAKDYQWARITGEGIPGPPGDNGVTYYTWVRYADDLYGNGMSDSPNGKYYIGLAFNKESPIESSDPREYQWSKYRGDDGTPGINGEDGKTTYFHVKYSSVPNPTSSWEMTETPSKYIGTYVDFLIQDSTNPRDYAWTQFQGDPGQNGIPGTNGQDGRTSYLHIAYANSADGNTDFSTTVSVGKTYMGQYVDYEERDSENPYMYKWSKIKGEDGTDGQDGVGISRITKYYLASERSAGITVNTYGWSTSMQEMTAEKKYLWSYDKIAYTNSTSVDTTPIIIGVRGESGENGIVVSKTPPDNPQVGQLWQTESGQPIMRWDGARWVLHYMSVENLDVKKLSAITSDLGTVNAGEINGVTIKGTRITGSSLIELQNKTKDGGLMWVKGNSEGLEVIKFSSTGTRVAGARITEEDIFIDGATRSFKGLNSDMNKTLQEPKLLVSGKTLAQGGSFVAAGVRGLLLLEVANSSARSRKMEVFIKGINAERNIHISYADGTSLNITITVTWSGSNATIKCTRFWAEGQWSGGTSQIYYAYTI